MPLVRPSELTSLASTRPRIGFFRACACAALRSTSATAPSARTKPSAAAEKAWHKPLGESMFAWEKAMNDAGLAIRLLPPTIAVSIRPLRMASIA